MKDATSVNGRKRSLRFNEENIVQWKQKNIKDGFIVVDESQLSKLIKREPIERYYKLEDTPFATGLFASVRRCRSLHTGVQFAAKFSSRKRYGEDCSAEIYHEIALLSLCGSAPRIIQIHDVFETAQEIILVMEYAPGGDLQTIIDDNLVPFESDVVSYVRQCLEGLDYLHQRRIAHLDIKPQNIVMMGQFPNCEIKLCDFEISRVVLDGCEIREILGTPDYVAPEILHYDPITLAADMWSLGVTTYVLLTGFSPFGGETDQETFCNISRGEVDFPDELFADVSDTALDFMRSLLAKNPKARPSSAQCLKHPWLAQKVAAKPVTTPTPPPSSPSALRKYLSKSREALFERVVQQHKSSLRKHTLQSQLYNKKRLYESQMSLISKSREKLLGYDRMSPSFSRSIEKIYGLRSLSKSQEVLNLYKNGNLLTSQENINNVVSEILKSRENLMEKVETDSKDKDRKLTRATTADLGMLRHRHRKLRIYSGSSTTSLTSDMAEEAEDRDGDAAQDYEETKETESRVPQIPQIIAPAAEEEIVSPSPLILAEPIEFVSSVTPVDAIEEASKDDVKVNGDKNKLITCVAENDTSNTGAMKRRDSDGDNIEEPRFTVAQLITAFNKHQEVVTKSSLEVTMTAQERSNKIPPLISYNKTPFPTGPKALRLFIPDIDLIKVTSDSKLHKEASISSDSSSTSSIHKSPSRSSETGLKVSEAASIADTAMFLRSISQSSEASTAVSTEDMTPDSSLEITEVIETKLPPRPSTLRVNSHRSKSQSPSPVCEIEKYPTRKLSAGSNAAPPHEARKGTEVSRKISGTTIPTRKLSNVEKSPTPQRRNRCEPSPPPIRKISNTPEFKIVGLGERNRKSHGISYKIEFASPVVTRRFPVRTPEVCGKTTISSELKKQENLKPRRREK